MLIKSTHPRILAAMRQQHDREIPESHLPLVGQFIVLTLIELGADPQHALFVVRSSRNYWNNLSRVSTVEHVTTTARRIFKEYF